MSKGSMGIVTTSAGRDPLLARAGAPPGRAGQLERFVDLAASLTVDGPGFHLLEAPAGLGKTHLLEAALDRLAGAGFRCVRAPSELGQEPYRTAVRLLGELGVSAGDLLGGRRAIENLLSDRAQADLDGLLGRLAQSALDATRTHPTVVVLDDFHWIDPASAGLVDALIKELAVAVPPPPVLLALAYRPIGPDAPASGLVARLAGHRVLVIGDVMLDRFIVGRVTRISPEAPVPVVHFQSEFTRLGGAANVAHNLAALGADVALVGVVGRDAAAGRLTRQLLDAGVSDAGLVVCVCGCAPVPVHWT